MGVIAQEVEKVFPEAVTINPEGNKAVSYSSLVAPLIGAVQELKTENDDLKTRMAKLEKEMAELRALVQKK